MQTLRSSIGGGRVSDVADAPLQKVPVGRWVLRDVTSTSWRDGYCTSQRAVAKCDARVVKFDDEHRSPSHGYGRGLSPPRASLRWARRATSASCRLHADVHHLPNPVSPKRVRSHERLSSRCIQRTPILEKAADEATRCRMDAWRPGLATVGHRVHAVLLFAAARLWSKHAGMSRLKNIIVERAYLRGS